MRNTILLIILTTLFFGCTSQKAKEIQEKARQKHHKEMEMKKIISDLITKYKIAYTWDGLDEEYSIAFKPVIESPYQLISDIEITDIYLKDSIEYVAIKVGFMPSFYFDFPITKEQEIKLLNTNSEFAFVVSIREIRKIRLEITGECDASVNIENTSSNFIGKGQLIEIASTLK